MNKRAEHLRSNDVLQEAVKVLQEVANDESALPDVRNKAAELAADRLRFLGKRGGALRMGRLLVESNPTRNFKHLKDVGVTCLIIGKNEEAEGYFRRAVEQDPTDGFALVHLGFALKMQNKYEECLAPFEDGVKSQEPGTEESKFRYHWGDALMRLGRKPEADQMFQEAAEAGVFLSKFQRSTYNIDRLTGRPYWEKSQLDKTLQSYWTRLEKKWEMMRDEALALMDENHNFPNFEKEAEGLQKEGDWRQFTLWQQGRKQERECKLTPKTCALIQDMKEATGCRRGQIKFSVMKEGTTVWPHTGPTNCRLRLHLGLRVPDDYENLSITVADQQQHWQNGKAFVFDDSFEHSVEHKGSSYRLVLIFDFWHPEMTEHEKRTVTAI